MYRTRSGYRTCYYHGAMDMKDFFVCSPSTSCFAHNGARFLSASFIQCAPRPNPTLIRTALGALCQVIAGLCTCVAAAIVNLTALVTAHQSSLCS
jgi:hypothetical protein